jgi:hypothetical protein
MLLLRGGALYSKPVQSGSALQAASHALSDNEIKGRLVPVVPLDVRQHPAGRICVYVGRGGTVVAPVVVVGCVVATVVVGCVVATVVGCVTAVVMGWVVATVVGCVTAVVMGCVVATVVVGCVEDVGDGAAAQIFGSQHFALSTAEHPGYLDDC